MITGEQLCKRYEALGKTHNVMKNVWDSCLHMYMPEMQGITYDNNHEGEKIQPVDFTGMYCAERLASGLFSNTVSMGDEFFGFRLNDPEFEEDTEIIDYFTEAAKSTLKYMQSSNFSLESYEMMVYYCSLMTGVLYSEFDSDLDSMVYENIPVSSCRISSDQYGKIRTVFREFEMTAEACYLKWGDKCPKKIKDKANNEAMRYEQCKFFHAVFNNPDYKQDSLSSEHKKFASYYVYVEDKEIIDASGYDTFPYAVPRFYVRAGNDYGRGVAFAALPALRELNALRQDMLDAIELGVQPPLLIPSTMEMDDIDIAPASIIPYDSMNGQPVFWPTQINLRDAKDHKMEIQDEIKDLFFVNLFMMLDQQKNMTATEVMERVAEKVQAITPVITRLYNEFFSDVIERTFLLLVENGKIPDFPEQIKGKDFSISYTTKLDNKLKALDTNQFMNAIRTAAEFKQMFVSDPELKYVFNERKIIRRILQNSNVEPDLLLDEDEGEAMREADQQAMAAAQLQQTMLDKVNLAPIDLSKESENISMPTIPDMMPEGVV